MNPTRRRTKRRAAAMGTPRRVPLLATAAAVALTAATAGSATTAPVGGSPEEAQRRRQRRRTAASPAFTSVEDPAAAPSLNGSSNSNNVRRRTQADPEIWYPNWSKVASAGNVCLSDSVHPKPSYMNDPDLLKSDPEECCDEYYWWDLATCRAGTSGIVAGGTDNSGGTGEWYANYADFRCARDCDPEGGDGPHCGGTTTRVESGGFFASAEECCSDKFFYSVLGLCVAESTGTTYEGTERYYVDYRNGRCVQDCPSDAAPPSGGDGQCGGIVGGSSTETYADAPSCCSARLSYMDSLLCETRSTAGGAEEGTFRTYPDLITGTCVIDKDPSNTIVCGIGYTCRLLPSSSWVPKLYAVSPAGVEECCAEGLPYVNPGYCKTRTMGIVSRKWYADYAAKRCFKDCEEASDPTCARNEDPTADLIDSIEDCCRTKLGYRNQARCQAESAGLAYEGTDMWYVDYHSAKCSMDCPADEGGDCGGVVGDANNHLYDDAATCCSTGLSYLDEGLCEDRSDHTATGTGRYYPREEDGACVKDTSQACPAGEICERVQGWASTLYDSIDDCCESSLGLLGFNEDYCKAISTGTGTEKWFSLGGDRCAKHCTVPGSSVECGVPTDPYSDHHSTAAACCAAELDYLNQNTCKELSEAGGILENLVGTDHMYVDWIRQKCVKNCPVGREPSCGGIAGGKWMQLFDNVDDCCQAIHYVDRVDCVKT